MNCGGCSYAGCDDGGDEVQVIVISTQVNWMGRGEPGRSVTVLQLLKLKR